MSLTELFIIAVGLSMDAFAVSVCKGLSVQRLKLGHALTCGVYFGGFQGLMPALGYLLGSQFQNVIVKVDHWIAFILLGIIGINMIRESRDTDTESLDDSFGFKAMLHQHRRSCGGSDLRFFKRQYPLGSDIYRCDHVYPLLHRSKGRPCIRPAL